MAIDYQAMAAKAKELIAAHGRKVTLRQLDRNPSNPDKTWRAGGAAPVEHNADAVIIPTEWIPHEERLVLRGEQTALVAPQADSPIDVDLFDKVLDDGMVWRIEDRKTLKPGNTVLLHILGLNK